MAMFYFGNRKPRGFHHNYIYTDERRLLLDELYGRSDDRQRHPEKEQGVKPQMQPTRLRRGRHGAAGNLLRATMPVVLLLAFAVLLFLALTMC